MKTGIFKCLIVRKRGFASHDTAVLPVSNHFNNLNDQGRQECQQDDLADLSHGERRYKEQGIKAWYKKHRCEKQDAAKVGHE